MPRVHLTALYASLALAITGLLLAIAALAVLGMNYSEQQARIADLEARDQSLGDLLDGLDAWVEYLHETQQNTKQSIAALDERSEEIADWQNETDVWTEGIVQWQADVASFMHRTRQQGVPAEWATWRGGVDRHIANVLGDVTAIRSGVTRNQSDISSLYDWSDEVTAYLNSGQQQGASAELAVLGELGAWATSVDRRIANLEEQSARVVDYLNSGQQPSTGNTNNILLDLILAYTTGDPAALARLAGHALTLAGG